MIKLNNISKYYHSNDVVTLGLRKVSLEFNLGEFIAVTGESGSGKSTLMNVISGLDTYEDGEMYIDGEETSYYSIEDWENYRKKYIGFVFQTYNIIDSYTVFDNVMLALEIQGYDKHFRKQRALELIERVGLTSHINQKAAKLSGGQRQRTVIARALAKDCPIIVADEPTGNLDNESSKKIIELLKDISNNKLVIIVTHNYDEVAEFCTRKIRLFDGEIIEDKEIKNPRKISKELFIEKYKMNLFDLAKIAYRNLIRVPKKSIFTLVVAIFISLVFLMGYGSFVEQNSRSRSPFSSLFVNITETRMIVTKLDRSFYTAEELDVISNKNGVKYVETNDPLLEVTIMSLAYWGEGKTYGYTENNFILPANVLTRDDLVQGRLPESAKEVVVSDLNYYNLGDTYMMGYTSLTETSSGNQFQYDFSEWDEYIIVGVAKNIESDSRNYNTVYFHSDFMKSKDNVARALKHYTRIVLDLGTDAPVKEPKWYYDNPNHVEFENNYITIDDSLEDNQVKVGRDLLYQIVNANPYDDEEYVKIENPTIDNLTNDLSLISYNDFTNFSTSIEVVGVESALHGLYMNRNTYNKLYSSETFQISVFGDNPLQTKKLRDEFKELGYYVIYPGEIHASPMDLLQKLFSSIAFGFFTIIVFIVIYFISYIVLKNIQKSKKKDYVIFRTIGATRRDLNIVTILELSFIMIVAFTITMVGLFVNEVYGKYIPKYLGYLSINNYILIILVLLLLAFFLGNRFNKKVFGGSVITSLKEE